MHFSPSSNHQGLNGYQFSESRLQSFTSDLQQKQSVSSNTANNDKAAIESYSETYTESLRQETRSFDGFKVFESVLSKSYQRISISESLPALAQGAVDSEAITAEKASKNILGFIEAQLRRDVRDGATTDELEARLETALTAFEKGFNQAKNELRAIGLLSQSVEDDIQVTYDTVTSGIKDLKQRLLGGEENTDTPINEADSNEEDAIENAAPNSSSNSNVVEENNQGNERSRSSEPAINTISSLAQLQERFQVDTQSNILASLNQGVASRPESVDAFSNYQFAQSNTFSFEVETADGDKVTVYANTKDLYASENTAGYFSETSEFSQGFQLEVDGELDEGELLALNDLFRQVERLSREFFSGDLDAAFEQAQNLGYDDEEIVGYSLNLRQVEVERVRIAYDEFAPDGNQVSNQLADALKPIGDFTKSLLEALEPASKFSKPLSLLQHLASYIEQVKINQEEKRAESTFDDVAELAGTEKAETVSSNIEALESSSQAANSDNNDKDVIDNDFFHSDQQRFAPFIKTILDSIRH